jgi:hypothetical protein
VCIALRLAAFAAESQEIRTSSPDAKGWPLPVIRGVAVGAAQRAGDIASSAVTNKAGEFAVRDGAHISAEKILPRSGIRDIHNIEDPTSSNTTEPAP